LKKHLLPRDGKKLVSRIGVQKRDEMNNLNEVDKEMEANLAWTREKIHFLVQKNEEMRNDYLRKLLYSAGTVATGIGVSIAINVFTASIFPLISQDNLVALVTVLSIFVIFVSIYLMIARLQKNLKIQEIEVNNKIRENHSELFHKIQKNLKSLLKEG
jgi:hypothetical protein